MAGNTKSMNNEVLCVKDLSKGSIVWAKKGQGLKKGWCNMTPKFRRMHLIATYGEDVDSRYNELRFKDADPSYKYSDDDKIFMQRYESSCFATDDEGHPIITIIRNGEVVQEIAFRSGSAARVECAEIPFDCTRLQSDARTGNVRKIEGKTWQVVFKPAKFTF